MAGYIVRKAAWVAPIITGVLVLDLVTKRWALEALADGRTLEMLGGFVPITLAYNRGAAFGLSIGGDPRWLFVPVTMIAIIVLGVLIRDAGLGDRVRISAASLVLGGAVGNLYDRLRWDRGVVDFIGPIDLGFMLWPIFNVADMAITCGAILLAISFWREEARAREGEAGAGHEGEEGGVPTAADR